MNHVQYEELAAGFALGALEPDDEHAFQRHLAGCQTCQALTRDLREVAAALAGTVPLEEPPATLRSAIRRRIGLTRARRLRAALRTPPRATTAGRVAVAAALVAVVAVSFWNMSLRNQHALDQQRLAAFERAARFASDPSTRQVTLQPAAGLPAQVHATVLASSLRDQGVLIVDGLGKPPPNKVYELWGLEGKSQPPLRATVFATSGGISAIPFALPIQPGTTWAVTVEAGPEGSLAPTTKPILASVAPA